jgi:hypothetical protein
MKLSESSHGKLESFFREFLGDESFLLPTIHFYTGKVSEIFTFLIKVNGITFGRRVFIMPSLLTLNRRNHKKLPEDLVVHEIMHVIQYQKEGLFKFFYKYLCDYRRNLKKNGDWSAASRRKAYLEIAFEIEARLAADKYLDWKDKLLEKTLN